jgi:hypothetical protein
VHKTQDADKQTQTQKTHHNTKNYKDEQHVLHLKLVMNPDTRHVMEETDLINIGLIIAQSGVRQTFHSYFI